MTVVTKVRAKTVFADGIWSPVIPLSKCIVIIIIMCVITICIIIDCSVDAGK